ncbi:uncharacterized protein LOC143484390 [Brachyhypopomus gauderio]|uniref:uncharacterized protein LOC143484390 n=1 Tax=Brachyhypopomus gauderio TaxID=698409 RepID=UPI00404381A7
MIPKINLDHLIPFLEQETCIPHRLQASSDSKDVKSSAPPVPGIAIVTSPVSDTKSTVSANTEGNTTAHPVPAVKVVTHEGDTESGIDDIWSGRSGFVLMAKIGPYKIFETDIARLAPGLEPESEVINAYMFAMVRQQNQQSYQRKGKERILPNPKKV